MDVHECLAAKIIISSHGIQPGNIWGVVMSSPSDRRPQQSLGMPVQTPQEVWFQTLPHHNKIKGSHHSSKKEVNCWHESLTCPQCIWSFRLSRPQLQWCVLMANEADHMRWCGRYTSIQEDPCNLCRNPRRMSRFTSQWETKLRMANHIWNILPVPVAFCQGWSQDKDLRITTRDCQSLVTRTDIQPWCSTCRAATSRILPPAWPLLILLDNDKPTLKCFLVDKRADSNYRHKLKM